MPACRFDSEGGKDGLVERVVSHVSRIERADDGKFQE